MSACAAHVININHSFFERLPVNLVHYSVKYLKGENSSDYKAIIATAGVSRWWRDNSILQKERKLASDLLCKMNEYGYPNRLLELFKACHVPIGQLHVLDINDRKGATSYFDFLNGTKMRQPIMRFKDRLGRSGIALHLQGKGRWLDVNLIVGLRNRPINTRGIDGTLVIFNRDPHGQRWTTHWCNNTEYLEGVYFGSRNCYKLDICSIVHPNDGTDNSPCCPYGSRVVNNFMLSRLLMDDDPLFRIAPTKKQRRATLLLDRYWRRAALVSASAGLAIASLTNQLSAKTVLGAIGIPTVIYLGSKLSRREIRLIMRRLIIPALGCTIAWDLLRRFLQINE